MTWIVVSRLEVSHGLRFWLPGCLAPCSRAELHSREAIAGGQTSFGNVGLYVGKEQNGPCKLEKTWEVSWLLNNGGCFAHSFCFVFKSGLEGDEDDNQTIVRLTEKRELLYVVQDNDKNHQKATNVLWWHGRQTQKSKVSRWGVTRCVRGREIGGSPRRWNQFCSTWGFEI